ncbi:MAG: hypothetical protein Q9186_004965 [Xanthomendoza sp. 1 TL-2023]
MACSRIPSEIRAFLGTWISYKEEIARGILERTIPCYDAAEELFTTTHNKRLQAIKEERIEDRTETDEWQLSLEYYASCILAGAKAAESACDAVQRSPSLFTDHWALDLPVRQYHGMVLLNRTERERPIYIYYNIRTISAVLNQSIYNWYDNKPPQSFIRSTSLWNASNHDLYLILEVARTLCGECPMTLDPSLDLGYSGRYDWYDLHGWEYLHSRLRHIALSRMGRNDKDEPGRRHGLRVLLDQYQYVLDE